MFFLNHALPKPSARGLQDFKAMTWKWDKSPHGSASSSPSQHLNQICHAFQTLPKDLLLRLPCCHTNTHTHTLKLSFFMMDSKPLTDSIYPPEPQD